MVEYSECHYGYVTRSPVRLQSTAAAVRHLNVPSVPITPYCARNQGPDEFPTARYHSLPPCACCTTVPGCAFTILFKNHECNPLPLPLPAPVQYGSAARTCTSPPSRVAGASSRSTRSKPSPRSAASTGPVSGWREGAPAAGGAAGRLVSSRDAKVSESFDRCPLLQL